MSTVDDERQAEIDDCPKCKQHTMSVYEIAGEDDHGHWEAVVFDCSACGHYASIGGHC